MSALATPVSIAYPYCSPHAEAHISGCKAAYRRVKRVDSDVWENAFTVADLIQMQANPDEGYFKIHACLKPTLTVANSELFIQKIQAAITAPPKERI